MNFNNGKNADFLSYQGTIGRKDYAINAAILSVLYVLISLIDFNSLSRFFSFQFFTTALIYIVGFLKFVLIIALISTVYRRINDFAKFDNKIKKVFIIFYIVPFLYYVLGRFLFDFIPSILIIADLIMFYVMLPLAVIIAIVLAFIKSK